LAQVVLQCRSVASRGKSAISTPTSPKHLLISGEMRANLENEAEVLALVPEDDESVASVVSDRAQGRLGVHKAIVIAATAGVIVFTAIALVGMIGLKNDSSTALSTRVLTDAKEACSDTLSASNCSSRRAACTSGRDTAQCNRCVYKLYCENQTSFTGQCFGRGVSCLYVAGHKIGTFCFPSSAAVQVLDGPDTVATRKMEHLKVGDRVLTAGGFSEVYAFMDHTTVVEIEYIKFATDSGAELRLTKDHIVFAHADRQPVLAADVKEGDFLWVADGPHALAMKEVPLRLSRVVAVTLEHARGAHAPLTVEGSLLVDGVLASSSAGVQTLSWGGLPLLTGHKAVMLVHSPLRFLCKLVPAACGPEWHSAELGRHCWTQWVLDHFGWLRTMNLKHHDLQVAFSETSVTAWASALVQVLTAVALVFCDAVLFSLSPWQAFAVLVLLWAKGMQGGPEMHFWSRCKTAQ